MNAESKPKRQYTRLSDGDWSTIREEWEAGDTTLADLSNRFGASIRSIQNFFERHGVTKGNARRVETMAAIRLAAPELPPTDASDPQAVKSLALRRVLDIEEAVASQLSLMKLDPTTAYRAGSTIKALQAAADTVAKVYALKRDILGLDRQDAQKRTVLTVRCLFDEEIARLREDDEDIDDDLPSIEHEDDDIVMESPA